MPGRHWDIWRSSWRSRHWQRGLRKIWRGANDAHGGAMTPNKAKVLKIQGLKKHFGKNEVLKGIDLEVGQGEVVAIIGPSGSGKSTLLRCVNFLEVPTAGSIYFKDELLGVKADENGRRVPLPEAEMNRQ